LESRMEFVYYPGCSLEGMNKAYDQSARIVSKSLGIDLKELNDWNCCGASAYMSIRELRAHLLSARNLAMAEKEKKDLAVVCPACYTNLSKTNHYMGEDARLRRTVGSALKAANLQYMGTVKVRHLLDVFVFFRGGRLRLSRCRQQRAANGRHATHPDATHEGAARGAGREPR